MDDGVYVIGRKGSGPPELIGPFDKRSTAEGFAAEWRARTPLATGTHVVTLTDPVTVHERWVRHDERRAAKDTP